jgi:hypothetical protein
MCHKNLNGVVVLWAEKFRYIHSDCFTCSTCKLSLISVGCVLFLNLHCLQCRGCIQINDTPYCIGCSKLYLAEKLPPKSKVYRVIFLLSF